MLEVLGVDAEAEAVYNQLVRHSSLTVAELTQLVDVDVPAALTTLVAGGLVRGPDEVGAYAALPPDIALRSLATAVEHRLDQARARTAALAAVYGAIPRAAGDSPVEVVPGEEAVDRFGVLALSATKEVRVFETPPYGPLPTTPWQPEMEGLQRGVRFRVVYSRAAIEDQSETELREPIGAGEQARVIDEVPLRLMLVDRELAMLPTQTGRLLGEGMLVVRRGALLDALSSLFETVWSLALPLTLSAEPDQPNEETLIALLAAGLGDQAIARQLGIGLRTVQRRIHHLMNSVHAATRFQAGLAIGRRHPPPDD